MIKIPAGPAVYQENETADLEEFQIDEYEVTIAQYAKFLEDLETHPEKAQQIRHPDQPENKTSYEPKDWKSIYAKAKKGRKFGGAPINLNCPIFQVDWWDAHAYAKWKGRSLPTEQQWEKAARGRNGSLYPWGDELDLKKFNSGVDQDESNNGNKDGYRYWAPVDAMSEDESRYGVMGMAGNVSEWTASWDTHPDFPDRKVPIKRGASFATKSNFELTARRPATGPEETNLLTGFRTVLNKNGGADSPVPSSSAPATASPPAPAPSPAAEGTAAPEPEPEPKAGTDASAPADAPAPAPAPETEADTESAPKSDPQES
jgi:formylglycine-generating enzyme required for sulfatase activity